MVSRFIFMDRFLNKLLKSNGIMSIFCVWRMRLRLKQQSYTNCIMRHCQGKFTRIIILTGPASKNPTFHNGIWWTSRQECSMFHIEISILVQNDTIKDVSDRSWIFQFIISFLVMNCSVCVCVSMLIIIIEKQTWLNCWHR